MHPAPAPLPHLPRSRRPPDSASLCNWPLYSELGEPSALLIRAPELTALPCMHGGGGHPLLSSAATSPVAAPSAKTLAPLYWLAPLRAYYAAYSRSSSNTPFPPSFSLLWLTSGLVFAQKNAQPPRRLQMFWTSSTRQSAPASASSLQLSEPSTPSDAPLFSRTTTADPSSSTAKNQSQKTLPAKGLLLLLTKKHGQLPQIPLPWRPRLVRPCCFLRPPRLVLSPPHPRCL
jgi:hypothetical protein